MILWQKLYLIAFSIILGFSLCMLFFAISFNVWKNLEDVLKILFITGLIGDVILIALFAKEDNNVRDRH